MNHLMVTNWDRFQQYKDRDPKWIKLYRDLLDDYEFDALSEVTQLHLIKVWLLAAKVGNKIPNDAQWIARRIGAQEEVDIDQLVTAGFLEPYAGVQTCTEMYLEEEEEEEREKTPAPSGAVAVDLKDSPPSTQPAQTKPEPEYGADEARFWGMAPAIQAKGVARSQIGRLANLLSGDFEDGIGILDAVLDAREPRAFLAAIIRDRGGGAKSRDGPKRPGFVEDAERDGFDVERDGENWIIGGEIYDQQGDKIGW